MVSKKKRISKKKENLVEQLEDFVKVEIIHRIEKHPPFMSWQGLKSYSTIILFSVLVFVGLYYWNTAIGVSESRSINRALGNMAFVFMGFTYVVAPLAVKWKFYSRFMYWRKYVGMVGFGYLLIHFGWTLLKSPLDRVFADFGGFGLGLFSLIIFIFLGVISNNFALKKIGGLRWRRIQQWGYYGLLFAFAHLFVKSWDDWAAWLATITTGVAIPPQSLFVFLFGLKVFIIRSYFFTFKNPENVK